MIPFACFFVAFMAFLNDEPGLGWGALGLALLTSAILYGKADR